MMRGGHLTIDSGEDLGFQGFKSFRSLGARALGHLRFRVPVFL